MLIGFTGAGGTGKTTTATLLSAKTGGSLAESPARSVFKRWKLKEADQRKMTPKEQLKLQAEIAEAKFEQDRKLFEKPLEEHTICDRTPIDTLAYTLFRAGTELSAEQIRYMLSFVSDHMRKYHLVFYTPLTVFEGQDEFREQGYGYNYCIDSLILKIIRDTGVEVTTLPVQPIDMRVVTAYNCCEATLTFCRMLEAR